MTDVMHDHHHHHNMIQLVSVSSFFIFGLITSLHCIGMCGPISTLFFRNKSGPKKTLVFYHLSRMTSYTLVGLVLGSIGVQVKQWIPFSWVTIFLCFVLVLYALPIHFPSISWASRLIKWIPLQKLTPGTRLFSWDFSHRCFLALLFI